MTVSLWRSTVTATLERSTVWCAADRPRIEVAWLSARGPGSAASAMMPARRRSSLVSALFGVGAGVLASCAYYQPQPPATTARSEEHTSELQSQSNLVCRLLLEKKK